MREKWHIKTAIFDKLAFSRRKAKYRIYDAWLSDYHLIRKEDINEDAWEDFEYLRNEMNFTLQSKKYARKHNINFEVLEKSCMKYPGFIRDMHWKKENKILKSMYNVFLNLKR